MRKIVGLAVFLTLILVGIKGEAKIYFRDTLIINGGADVIEMAPGEKIRLDVREGLWEYPLYDGFRFLSTDKSVAWVDRRGLVHAMLPGEVEILVIDKEGRNSNITVKVTGDGKLSRGQIIAFFVFFASIFGFFVIQKLRCFH